MFFLAIALLFILKLKFKNKNLTGYLLNKYGVDGLRLFRKFENFDKKARKILCDIEFLNCCLTNNLSQKFINFKLSLRYFQRDTD